MAKRKRKPKTTSAYDAVGNISPEEIAQEVAKVFQGEMMTNSHLFSQGWDYLVNGMHQPYPDKPNIRCNDAGLEG